MNKVIKRNGQEVDFQIEKIEKAISAANNEVEGADKISIVSLRSIVDEVERRCEKATHALNVEDIQNIVEEVIMEEGYFEVARHYIKYRYLHGMIRDQYQALMSEVAKKLEATDIQNQNANVDEASFGGRQGEASNYLTSQYALDYCVSKKAKENHLNNEIYIHDLSSYAVGSHNCLTIPFDDLLANGFVVRQTDVRPAQSVSTAFQLLAVIFQIQSLQQFGGVSASHLDWTMVPYVRKSFYKYALESFKYFDDCILDYLFTDENDNPRTDIENISLSDYESLWVSSIQKQYCYDKIEKEIHQAVEGMYHNLKNIRAT